MAPVTSACERVQGGRGLREKPRGRRKMEISPSRSRGILRGLEGVVFRIETYGIQAHRAFPRAGGELGQNVSSHRKCGQGNQRAQSVRLYRGRFRGVSESGRERVPRRRRQGYGGTRGRKRQNERTGLLPYALHSGRLFQIHAEGTQTRSPLRRGNSRPAQFRQRSQRREVEDRGRDRRPYVACRRGAVGQSAVRVPQFLYHGTATRSYGKHTKTRAARQCEDGSRKKGRPHRRDSVSPRGVPGVRHVRQKEANNHNRQNGRWRAEIRRKKPPYTQQR